MKRRLLFILQSFEIGGTTVSTRNLVSVLNKETYDIIVWTLNDKGTLRWMYEGVSLLPTCFTARAIALNGWRDADNTIEKYTAAIVRLLTKWSFFKRLLFRHAINKCVGSKQFDTIIATQEGLTTQFASVVPGERHVAWIRCDYKRISQSQGGVFDRIYECYDSIICVAEKARESFVEIYPSLTNKTLCIYNPQDSNLIVSNSEMEENDSRFNVNSGKVIVSMGRLDRVKRFDMIPQIAKKLNEKGLSFKWFIIGDGGEKQRIEDAITNNGINDKVIMLGAKSNPHYYLKRADLYVCLSSSEACPRVINEAKILGTPVVSTDFPTVYEYLEDGINGRISSIENIPFVIEEMLTDNDLYCRIKKEIESFSFDNAPLVSKLEEIL